MKNVTGVTEAISGTESLSHPKWLKRLSIFLGLWMFAFGVLKCFPPISGWFLTQITKSGLPLVSVPAGKTTEMLVGLMLFVPWMGRRFSIRTRFQINVVASIILIFQMAVATYVHLQPNVPAEVLPLGIKPPFIPLGILLLAALNGSYSFKLCCKELKNGTV
jgi:hypothetical protein